MPVISVIFWGMALFTVVAVGLGINGKPRWYWWAALASYVCSFLSGFSIGLSLLSLTFVLVMVALGHSFHLIRVPWHSVLAGALGLGVLWLAVTIVDDSWLFLPFRLLLDPWLSGGSSAGAYGSCTEVDGVLKCTQVRY